jgi:hypothetical protein
MTITRRQTLIGAAATVVAAALPPVAMAEVADPAVEHLRSMFGQLVHLLRSQGFALSELTDGGKVLVWLTDPDDITSMFMTALGDETTPDVVEVLSRAKSIRAMAAHLTEADRDEMTQIVSALGYATGRSAP